MKNHTTFSIAHLLAANAATASDGGNPQSAGRGENFISICAAHSGGMGDYYERKKPINIRVGGNIQRMREERHYTQKALSEKVGVTPNHLSAMERGISGLSLELLGKLCQVLEVSSDQLLFGRKAVEKDDIHRMAGIVLLTLLRAFFRREISWRAVRADLINASLKYS